MLERVITAIGQSLSRGGRTSIVSSLNSTLALIILGVIGFQWVGIPTWIIGMTAFLPVVVVLMIGGIYFYGLKTKKFDILRSEFFLLSKMAAQREDIRGDDLKTFMTLASDQSERGEGDISPPTLPGTSEVNP